MATQELSPEIDEDVFDLTEIISSDDDILDLSIDDKVEDSSSTPNEAPAPAQEAAAQAAPPPPPRPEPSNASEAEDMALDDLLSQLESGEDLKDENYGLPQQSAPPTDDLDDLDDLGDITAAINAKREAFDADLASAPEGNTPSTDEEGADLDDLLAGLDAPDVGGSAPSPSSGGDDLDSLDDIFDSLDGLDDIGDGQASSSGDDLDDLDGLFDGLDDLGTEESSGGQGEVDDLDDLFGSLDNDGGQEAIAAPTDLEDEFADFDSSALTPISEREEEVLNFDDLESMLDAEAPIKPKDDDPFADLDDFLDELETTTSSAPVESAVDELDSFEEDLDFGDLASAAMDTNIAAVPPKQKDPLEDNDELADLNELFEEFEEHVEKPITAGEDIDSLLGEFAEVASPAEEASDDFIDDLDDFVNETDAVIDPIIDDAILDIDTSEEAESIEFTSEEDLGEEIFEEDIIEEDSDISSYIDEFDVLPNLDEEILTVEEAVVSNQPQSAPAPVMQMPIAQAFDNTNNQTQLNLLFAEFRLLGSEIAELKRKDRTNDKDIFLPVVGKELSCKDVEDNLSALRAKLANFEQSLSSMQENVQNVASDLAVDAEGEERSSIDNFIIEMSESFDSFSKSLTLFDNKISEMEKANTEMETSMTVLRTKVEKNAAKIELLSTRLDNVDATFANLENIVANTAARIIREELAAMLAEESGDTYQEPISQTFNAPTFEEEISSQANEMPLDDLDDISLDMPELDFMETEEADMSGLDESLADVMDDMMPSITDVMNEMMPADEINLDEMLDAPIETIAEESSPVSEEIDPFEAMSEQAEVSEVTANAAPEDFDMDALFDTEEK